MRYYYILRYLADGAYAKENRGIEVIDITLDFANHIRMIPEVL